MIKGVFGSMYSISEAAKKIGVSRQSIYKKLDKSELQPYLQDSEKGKLISEEGLPILKDLFTEWLEVKETKVTDARQTTDSKVTDNLHEVDNVKTDDADVVNRQPTDNSQTSDSQATVNSHTVNTIAEEYINSLKAETEHLKGVIASQAQQITDLTRLLENSQVLLKHEQQRHIPLLADEQTKEKRSLWNIFRKQ